MKEKIIEILIIMLTLNLLFVNLGVAINLDKSSSINSGSNEITEYYALLIAPPNGNDEFGFCDSPEYLHDVLIEGGWNQDNIILLLGNNATKTNLIESINQIANKDKTSDNVLISFYGHGDVGEFCLKDDYVKYEELNNYLKKLNSSSITIILNACHSGSAIPYLKAPGRVILTSCKSSETCGFFLQALITGLYDFADVYENVGNKNGAVSIEEAFNYAINDYSYYYTPQIQDDFFGELNIFYQNYETGRLDQYTTTVYPETSPHYSIRDYVYYAQSFIPQVDILTKIKLRTRASFNEPDAPLTLSIRKTLNGQDLTFISIDAEIIHENQYQLWVFDFPDIDVISGEEYFFVLSSPGSNVKGYGLTLSTSDIYPDGRIYYSLDYGETWKIQNDADDSVFMTYGFKNGENLPPHVPRRPCGLTTFKPGQEKSFNVVTSDANDDNLYYIIDWGDGTDSGWKGPYNSGEVCSIEKTYQNNGGYRLKVKAKDEHGLESDWSDSLSISIKKGKASKDLWLFQFQDIHSIIYQIFKPLLNL